jgi:uncharacterized membrane protein (UPF0127 family)
MKISLVLLIIALSGCITHPRKPEPMPVRAEMDETMIAVISQLVWLKSDPNVFKVKELDPFRRR